MEQATTKERSAQTLAKKFALLSAACERGAPEEELYVLPLFSFIMDFSNYFTLICPSSTERYNELMAECDEVELLTSRVPFIARAQSVDVNETLKAMAEMKKEINRLHVELNQLLAESELRAQVAVVNTLPTCKSIQQYV